MNLQSLLRQMPRNSQETISTNIVFHYEYLKFHLVYSRAPLGGMKSLQGDLSKSYEYVSINS